jgi:hypothetical protein
LNAENRASSGVCCESLADEYWCTREDAEDVRIFPGGSLGKNLPPHGKQLPERLIQLPVQSGDRTPVRCRITQDRAIKPRLGPYPGLSPDADGIVDSPLRPWPETHICAAYSRHREQHVLVGMAVLGDLIGQRGHEGIHRQLLRYRDPHDRFGHERARTLSRSNESGACQFLEPPADREPIDPEFCGQPHLTGQSIARSELAAGDPLLDDLAHSLIERFLGHDEDATPVTSPITDHVTYWSECEVASRSVDLLSRVRRLEDRFAINDLLVRYAVLLDDRRFDDVGCLFTVDGTFSSPRSEVVGREAIAANFARAHDPFPVTLHDPHAHLVDFLDDDHARGTVIGYAELAGPSETTVTSIRYHDDYQRVDDRWLFASRHVLTVYRLPLADLIDGAAAATDRVRPHARPAMTAELPDTDRRFTGYLGDRIDDSPESGGGIPS